MNEERRKQLLLDCMSMQFSISSGDITVSYRDVVDLAIVHEEVCGERDHLVSQHAMRVAEIHAMGEEIKQLRRYELAYHRTGGRPRDIMNDCLKLVDLEAAEKGDV